jgi:hypothetical protein
MEPSYSMLRLRRWRWAAKCQAVLRGHRGEGEEKSDCHERRLHRFLTAFADHSNETLGEAQSFRASA